MRLSTTPDGARASYRIVMAADPTSERTPWQVIGPTPLDGDVVVDPRWREPISLLQLRFEHPGFETIDVSHEPSAVLTAGKQLRTHVTLPTARPAPEASGQ
jgi:hypothetical protein